MKFTRDDIKGIIIATSIYFLQGIPLGLFGAFFLILKDYGVDYEQMAILSVAVYPFSIKVLWACIPDSIWLPALGQRRTWIIFAQSVIGALLFALGFVFDDLAKDKNIVALTCILFVVIFFVTVQDIAVDGWCVTLLSDELQPLGGTCQTVGQTLGAMSFNLYLSLLDPYFGIAFASYLKICGAIFLIACLIILVFVAETNYPEMKNGLAQIPVTYKKLFRLFLVRAIAIWLVVCLTCKISFAPHGEVYSLRLRDNCVTKSEISNISLLMKGPNILITLCLASLTVKAPMRTFLYTIPFYTLTASLSCVIIKFAEQWVADGSITYYLFAYELINRVAASGVYLSVVGLHFKVAQPDIGSTYLTLLNSFFNLGGVWVETASLKWIGFMDRDVEKMPSCYCDQYKTDYNSTCFAMSSSNSSIIVYHSNVDNFTDVENDKSLPFVQFEPESDDAWDNYFTLAIAAVSIGTIWYVGFFRIIKRQGQIPTEEWWLPEYRELMADKKLMTAEKLID